LRENNFRCYNDRMKEFKTALFTTIAILVVFFLYTKFTGPIPFSVNSVTTAKTNLFSVSGTGKATGIPDTAQISIGVTKTALTVSDAQNQTNTAANKIIEDLKKLGIEEKNIKTTDYNVSPNYNYGREVQNITGYTITQTLAVKISPIDIASKAIDAATLDGANLVNGVTFTFNDKTKKDLENKARTEAVKMAKEKAQNLSTATGIRLGKIVDVQESSGYTPRPVMMMASKAMEDNNSGAGATQLAPGENSVTIDITLSYETL
jgi:uncharacterized protein